MQVSRGFVGRIDVFGKNEIGGWLTSADTDGGASGFLPLLFVGGRPARLLHWQQSRGDVNKALGIPGNFGFTFRVDQAVTEGTEVELYASDGENVVLVHKRPAKADVCAPPVADISQILNAKALSDQSGSVAITCWDGGHNPVGRAMVLHDCVAKRRPVVLFAYLFAEYGGKIWPPIEGEMFNRVLIPWDRRATYIEYIRSLDIEFSTVWMCKPRLPTFELAANISGKHSRFLLDHDDNELHFSRSQPTRQFGFYAMSLAGHLASKVTSNTVASISLSDEIDNAVIVRHARETINTDALEWDPSEVGSAYDADATQNHSTSVSSQTPIKIGFIGTVRKHKGLLEAARLIRLLAWESGQPYEFHVYGDFKPGSLRDELEEFGVVTHGQIAREELPTVLQSFDVILSGCTPSSDSEDITRHQISSKIGDALAVGRPVLVPDGPSVADLDHVTGVHLYKAGQMGEAIQAAISAQDTIMLPAEFTFDGAFKTFEAAERSASSIYDELAPLRFGGSESQSERTLVLLWKQPDGGFFGRRVDQLARTYRQRYPDHRVIVLETCHRTEIEHLRKTARDFTSANGALLESSFRKRALSESQDGVEYHMIVNENISSMHWNFEKYLMENGLHPENTRFVIFPLIRHLNEIANTLRAYNCVVDCVDNQLYWVSEEKRVAAAIEYYQILKSGTGVIFNSEENHDFFMDTERWGDLEPPPREAVLVAPNWYDARPFQEHKRLGHAHSGPLKVLYSGNLSDRIDWDLMDELAGRLPDAEIHIVGGIRNPGQRFDTLLENPNVIYWGPLSERRLAELLTLCHVGIVPHCADDVSTFMNPLKVHMYREFGLPVISTEVPGIAQAEGLTLCLSHDEFIDQVKAIGNQPNDGHRPKRLPKLSPEAERYLSMLSSKPQATS